MAGPSGPSELHDNWTLWFHDPKDESWKESSYRHVLNIENVDEWTTTHIAFKEMWIQGMFWIMRKGILPIWEDPANARGGCFSFKIMKPEVADAWFRLCSLMLGESLVNANKRKTIWNQVTGMAITPKRNYCVLRIWIADSAHKDIGQFTIPVPSYTTVLYKPHQDKIVV